MEAVDAVIVIVAGEDPANAYLTNNNEESWFLDLRKFGLL